MTNEKNTPLKQQLQQGQVVMGAQLRFGSPTIGELFGFAGYDFLIIDCEHAAQSPWGVQAQLQAIGCTPAAAIVRVGQPDPDLIRLYLDIGAQGIVAPMISTPEQAEQGARACRYYPDGSRSAGTGRAARFGFDSDYFHQSNERVMFIPIIETVEAVENIDKIFSVEGVDSYNMGPVDLSINLGVPMQLTHPKVIEATETVLQAAKKAGIPAGCGACGFGGKNISPVDMQQYIRQGYQMLWLSGDEWILSNACRDIAEKFNKLTS